MKTDELNTSGPNRVSHLKDGAVGQLADGVIVGSACVKTMGEAPDLVRAVGAFARTFKTALEQTSQVSETCEVSYQK